MSFRNISLSPLKMSSTTPLGLKDWRTILGQASFCLIPELWSLLWLCHAVTFCCFWTFCMETHWNIVFSSLKIFTTDALNPKSPHLWKSDKYIKKLSIKNWLGTVFWKGGNLECHSPIKEAFSLQQEYLDIWNRFFLHCYHIEFT